MAEKFDVIIVGAGPAGSTTAKYVSSSGASTLLIDKRKIIGVPVQCGEFLPTARQLQDILPNAQGIDELFDDKLIKYSFQKDIRRIIIISPKGREYAIDFDGFTINRNEFDQKLASQAVDNGAKLLTDTKFIRLEKNRVYTTNREFEGKVIVAADGPYSLVCQDAGLEQVKTISPALTCQVKGEFDNSLRMYFSKKIAPGGFAWIIPKKNCANVGLGIQKSRVPIHRLLKKFLTDNGFKTKRFNVGFVPISGPLPETVKGNVVAVGDAAGQVMATNGGGIPIAMICGRIAGLTISEHLRKGISLNDYETAWRKAVGNELQTATKTKNLADYFYKTDFTLEFIIKRLGTKGLEKAIKCQKVFKIFKYRNRYIL